MLYPIKALIFDLDGVIIDSNPAIEYFWHTCAKEASVKLDQAMIRQWIHGRKIGDTLEGVFSHLSDERKKEIETSAIQFDKMMLPELLKGAFDFISYIQSYAIPIGIVTSSHDSRLQQILAKHTIENHFTHFITAHDVTKGKPDPEPYLAMSQKMGIKSADCLVFEDAISGIQSAIAAGMLSIGIGDKEFSNDLKDFGALDVIANFTQLSMQSNSFHTINGIGFQV